MVDFIMLSIHFSPSPGGRFRALGRRLNGGNRGMALLNFIPL